MILSSILATLPITMSTSSDTHIENPLVDNLIEDEAEKDVLLAKPTCFVIFGKPVSEFKSKIF